MHTTPADEGGREPAAAPDGPTTVQAAVELFVGQHACGQAPDPAAFAQRFPEHLRPQLLAQLREFLAFDGLLGHQPWEQAPAPETAGRAFGDFVIQEELGRGGMGVVYLAHQRSLNRRVALKVMASGLTLSKRHVERFRREAAAAAQCKHPAIVPVHSFTEVDGTFAFAMDFIAGRNLADVLDDLRLGNGDAPGAVEGSLGIQPEKGYVAECAMLCAQLASALAAAHQAGVVHRDLKPRNLMLDERRQARLLDFGLAKSLGEGSLSMSGEITGTAHYMSPEQTLGKRVPIDHRTDIWSLGVILYELLTLRRPFDGKNLQQVVYEICFKEPVPIQRRNPKVPRDLVTICQKAIEKDPQNRYQTAAEFEADLLRFLRWEPIQAKPAGPLVRLSKWVHRHRTETIASAVAVCLAAGALGLGWYRAADAAARADRLLQDAQRAADEGDLERAIANATEALALRDDAAVRTRLDLFREMSLREATQEKTDIAEAALLVQNSHQAIDRDRELAVLLALEAVRRRPSPAVRSAVLAALGAGYRTTTLRGHDGQVLCARWAPNGRSLATTGADGTAVLWDAAGEPRATLRGHAQWVVDADFHPDGALLATAGVDRTVRLWRTGDGAPAGIWQHTGAVTMVRFDGAGRTALTTSYAAEKGPFHAQVWDVATGGQLAQVEHAQHIVAAAISPDGRFVASWGGERSGVRLWDAATGATVAELGGHGDRVRAIAFAPGGRLVATAAMDGGVRLYTAPAGGLVAEAWHGGHVDALAFDHDGGRLLTGSRDQTARLWDLTAAGTTSRLRELRTFVGHGGAILQVGFDRSGQLAVTAGQDGAVRVFDASGGRAPTGVELMRYEVGAQVEAAAFDPEGRRILAVAGKQRALVWDFGDTRGTVTLRQPGAVPAACFDARGERVVTAGDDERLRCWDAHDGRLLWVTDRLGNPLQTVDVDDAGERIVASTIDGRIVVHRLADGERLFLLPGHKGRLPVARFAARSTRLVTAGADRTAIVWNPNDQSRLLTLERPSPLVAADLDAAGEVLATVERGEAVVRLWSVPDRRPLGELAGRGGAIAWVRFSPDGQTLLTAGDDGRARVQARDGRLVLEVDAGHPLQHACFSRDGAFVLACAAGRTFEAQLWQVADGTERLRFGGHRNTVEWGAFSPDGAWAVTASRDGTARIWPTDPVAVANRLQLRSLTDAERRRYGLDTAPERK